MENDKQRKYFIQPKYSLTFAVRVVVLFSVGFASFAGILFLILNRKLGIGYFEDITTLSRLQESLPVIFVVTALLQSLVLSLILLFIFLYWGHAVSGPLVRVKRYLKSMGTVIPNDPMIFRQKDQLHNFTQSFQELQKVLSNHSQEYQKSLDNVQILVNELELLYTQKSVDSEAIQRKKAAIKKAYRDLQRLYNIEEIT